MILKEYLTRPWTSLLASLLTWEYSIWLKNLEKNLESWINGSKEARALPSSPKAFMINSESPSKIAWPIPIFIPNSSAGQNKDLGWVWFSFLKLGFLEKWGFQKVWYETEFFEKIECLVKAVKKCFLKKLSVWLAFIKVAVWEVNYQKWQCIYKENSLF